jgi:hypothetical protein
MQALSSPRLAEKTTICFARYGLTFATHAGACQKFIRGESPTADTKRPLLSVCMSLPKLDVFGAPPITF